MFFLERSFTYFSTVYSCEQHMQTFNNLISRPYYKPNFCQRFSSKTKSSVLAAASPSILLPHQFSFSPSSTTAVPDDPNNTIVTHCLLIPRKIKC